MRGQKSKMKRMQRGQTIVAEREHAETESERIQEHQRTKRRHKVSVLLAILVLVALGLLIYMTGKNVVEQYETGGKEPELEYTIKAQIVDEDNRGKISTRIKNYIAQLEQDLADLGYMVTQVILPTGTSRELYVDLAGRETYLKVNIDRDTAVTAEDADRTLRYLDEHDLHPTYADVRVEGRAFYK